MTQRLVLIADDNEDIRSICKAILESRGFAVVQARTGAEAVETARQHRPDLIFLDLIMPEMDGWEAIALLKEDPDARSIPVVAMTSSEPPPARVRRAGFCALVTKPVAPFEIVEAVRVCLEAHERGRTWIPDLRRRLTAEGFPRRGLES